MNHSSERSTGIGIDLEAIATFRTKKINDTALRRIFTEYELAYCFKKKHPAQHLAARFAAKEAVVKALSQLGIADVTMLQYQEIEVRTTISGVPTVQGSAIKALPVQVSLSLSHSGDYAIAVALINSSKN